MAKQTGEYRRDASDRLCFQMFDLDAMNYPKLLARIVDHFGLKSTSDMLVGADRVIGGITDRNYAIGLDWENWPGFFVTAHTPKAERLARSIGGVPLAKSLEMGVWHGSNARTFGTGSLFGGRGWRWYTLS